MPNRFPLSTAPVVTPAGISTPPAGAFSSLSDALAADGFDALGRWIADFTTGVGPIPAPIPCANTQPSADGAARSLVGIARPDSEAGEGRPSSLSPADGGDDWSASLDASDDPELLEYQRSHRWVRQACGECSGRGFYNIPADFRDFRWCAACDGVGEVLRMVEVAGEEVDRG